MKQFRLKEENADHFLIHDTRDQSDFKVAKAHLNLPMMAKLATIQKFDDGGTVKPETTDGNTGTPMEAPASQPTQSSYPSYDPTLQPGVGVLAPQDQNQTMLADNTQAQAIPTSMSIQPQSLSQDPFQQYLGTLQSASGQEKEANTQIAQATKAASDEQAQKEAQGVAALQNAQNVYQKHFDNNWNENTNLAQKVQNAEIDPNRFWNSKSTGQKLGMLAGMIVAGFGSGHGDNPAEKIIEKSIDDDINAQKTNLGKTQSLLSNNLAKFGTLNAAFDATRLNSLAMTKGLVNAAAAKQGGAIAMANAQKFNAELDKAMAGLTQQIAMQKMSFDLLNKPSQIPDQGGTPIGGIDQQRYMYLKLLGAVDPKDVPKIQDEMTRYGKLGETLKFIDEQGQKLKDLQHVGNYLQHPIDTRDLVNATQDNLATAASKDAEGRINETVFNSNRKQTQSLIDSPETAEAKLENLKDSARMLHGGFPMLDYYKLVNVNDPNLISQRQTKNLVSNKFRPVSPNSSYAGNR